MAYNEAVAEWFAKPPLRLEGRQGVAGERKLGVRVCAAAVVERGRVKNLSFRAYACPHIIAACNLLARQLVGEPVEALVDPHLPDRLQVLEIPVEKAGKILILQDALRACYDACRGTAAQRGT